MPKNKTLKNGKLISLSIEASQHQWLEEEFGNVSAGVRSILIEYQVSRGFDPQAEVVITKEDKVQQELAELKAAIAEQNKIQEQILNQQNLILSLLQNGGAQIQPQVQPQIEEVKEEAAPAIQNEEAPSAEELERDESKRALQEYLNKTFCKSKRRRKASLPIEEVKEEEVSPAIQNEELKETPIAEEAEPEIESPVEAEVENQVEEIKEETHTKILEFLRKLEKYNTLAVYNSSDFRHQGHPLREGFIRHFFSDYKNPELQEKVWIERNKKRWLEVYVLTEDTDRYDQTVVEGITAYHLGASQESFERVLYNLNCMNESNYDAKIEDCIKGLTPIPQEALDAFNEFLDKAEEAIETKVVVEGFKRKKTPKFSESLLGKVLVDYDLASNHFGELNCNPRWRDIQEANWEQERNVIEWDELLKAIGYGEQVDRYYANMRKNLGI